MQLKEKRVHDVKVIVEKITKGARNELEKLRAIWVWLCHNIGACSPDGPSARGICTPTQKTLVISFSAYDVKGYLGEAERLTAPEEVIAAGCGVCCGYSNLCTEMCR